MKGGFIPNFAGKGKGKALGRALTPIKRPKKKGKVRLSSLKEIFQQMREGKTGVPGLTSADLLDDILGKKQKVVRDFSKIVMGQ